MDIFKEVRERASIIKVCEVLGIHLDRSYKAICPFPDHHEKTASFSVSAEKNIFCCFGCGKKGDCITLVELILNTSPLESVKYINSALNLGLDIKNNRTYEYKIIAYNEKRRAKIKFEQWENKTFQLLCDYLHLLICNEEKYRPLNENEEFNDLYVEALQEKDKIEYFIDNIFINGTDEDKQWFKRTCGKVVDKYGRKLRE